MKVLDLRCEHGHGFEGWFGSEDDFAAQSAAASIACPICGSGAIDRLPSAPRLNVSRHAATEPASPQRGEGVSELAMTMQSTMQTQWLRAVQQVMKSTEDVGDRFVEEARKIHYGEVEERGIRGRASSEDAAALREEGISVVALPIPDALKGPIQ